MQKELRTKLDNYAKSRNWDDDDGIVEDETIQEILTEAIQLKEYGHDEHRWYTMFSVVVQIEDFFVDFQTYSNSGDEPAFDRKEWQKMVFDSAVEVFPKEITTIDYVTKDKLKD